VSRGRVSTGTDTMIPVTASLTCRYKKYLNLLPVSIHFQFLFPTRCGFYLRIPTNTNYFDIPNCHKTNYKLAVVLVVQLVQQWRLHNNPTAQKQRIVGAWKNGPISLIPITLRTSVLLQRSSRINQKACCQAGTILRLNFTCTFWNGPTLDESCCSWIINHCSTPRLMFPTRCCQTFRNSLPNSPKQLYCLATNYAHFSLQGNPKVSRTTTQNHHINNTSSSYLVHVAKENNATPEWIIFFLNHH